VQAVTSISHSATRVDLTKCPRHATAIAHAIRCCDLVACSSMISALITFDTREHMMWVGADVLMFSLFCILLLACTCIPTPFQHLHTAASLLVNGTHASEAAGAAGAVGLPLGLHFNVTEGSPSHANRRSSLLVRSTGVFRGKQGFFDAVDAGEVRANTHTHTHCHAYTHTSSWAPTAVNACCARREDVAALIWLTIACQLPHAHLPYGCC
jgi:hypothetical protein